MSSSKIQGDMRLKQFELTVVDFLTKESGFMIVVSDDSVFTSVLRSTLVKQLAVTDDCFSAVPDEDRILKVIKDTSARRKQFVLFIEQNFRGRDTSFLVRQIKGAFPNVKIIILTSETDRQRLVLLHEIGADNFITKPISINTLIEKIAFTIKPQGKIGTLIDKAKAELGKGAYENALKLSRQILELKPNSAAALIVMGDAFRGLGEKKKAVECYQTASNNAPLFMDPLKKLADFYQAEGAVEEQLIFLEKLDKLSPLNAERKVDMGTIHTQLGNHEAAEDLFDTALEQASAEASRFIEEISRKIASIYKDSDPAKAEKYYRHALDAKGDRLDSSDIATFNQLGMSLRRQGKWLEAVTEYRRALSIMPEDENLYYNLALAYAEGRQFREAAEAIGRSLDINPEFYKADTKLCYNMALICSKSGKKSLARKLAEHCVLQDPDNKKANDLLMSLPDK